MKKYSVKNMKKAIRYQDDTNKRVQEYRDDIIQDHEEAFAEEMTEMFKTTPALALDSMLNALLERHQKFQREIKFVA